MARLWRTLVRMLREFGVSYTSSLLIQNFVPPALFYLRGFYVMRADLADWMDRGDVDPDVRWATEDDADLLAAAVPEDASTIRAQMKSGARAAILVRDGAVRASCWLKHGIVDMEHWLRIVVPDDAVFSTQTYVPQPERRQGHFARVNGFANHWAAVQGYRWEFNVVDRLNRNSWRARERLGGCRVGSFFAVSLCGVMAVRAGRRWHWGRWNPNNRFWLSLDAAVDRPPELMQGV